MHTFLFFDAYIRPPLYVPEIHPWFLKPFLSNPNSMFVTSLNPLNVRTQKIELSRFVCKAGCQFLIDPQDAQYVAASLPTKFMFRVPWKTSLFHVIFCEDASVNILHLPVDSTLTSSMGRCHGFKCSTLMTELLCRPTVWYMFVTGWNRPWSLELLRCALPPFVIPELSLECGMRR